MDTPAPQKTPAIVWVGRVISLLPAAMVLMGVTFMLTGGEEMSKEWVKGGFPADTQIPIGIAALVSTVLFLIPQTATLGAILLTGYFGGAICHHVRNGEKFELLPALVCGVLVWLGLLLRDERLRPLLPLRKL
jgi:hypothetical protein